MTRTRTYCGALVDLLRPTPETIHPRDIAHHLALINRYAGATPVPWSVAQHSVHVMHLVEREGGTPQQCLAALLHDAHEAYVGDITRPVKRAIEFHRSGLDARLDEAVAARFGLTFLDLHDPLVREADDRLLVTEWIDLGLRGPRPFPHLDRAPFALKPWPWTLAEERFGRSLEAASINSPHLRAPVPTGIIK